MATGRARSQRAPTLQRARIGLPSGDRDPAFLRTVAVSENELRHRTTIASGGPLRYQANALIATLITAGPGAIARRLHVQCGRRAVGRGAGATMRERVTRADHGVVVKAPRGPALAVDLHAADALVAGDPFGDEGPFGRRAPRRQCAGPGALADGAGPVGAAWRSIRTDRRTKITTYAVAPVPARLAPAASSASPATGAPTRACAARRLRTGGPLRAR